MKVGFIGLGNMGGNMAARFLQAGYPVYGTEQRKAHASELIDSGLVWCETTREVDESADIVFTSLPDDSALLAVAEGPMASSRVSLPTRPGST